MSDACVEKITLLAGCLRSAKAQGKPLKGFTDVFACTRVVTGGLTEKSVVRGVSRAVSYPECLPSSLCFSVHHGLPQNQVDSPIVSVFSPERSSLYSKMISRGASVVRTISRSVANTLSFSSIFVRCHVDDEIGGQVSYCTGTSLGL